MSILVLYLVGPSLWETMASSPLGNAYLVSVLFGRILLYWIQWENHIKEFLKLQNKKGPHTVIDSWQWPLGGQIVWKILHILKQDVKGMCKGSGVKAIRIILLFNKCLCSFPSLPPPFFSIVNLVHIWGKDKNSMKCIYSLVDKMKIIASKICKGK